MHCLVAVSEDALADYKPPPNVERRAGFAGMSPRRTYDLTRNAFEDAELSKRFSWTGRSMTPSLREAVEEVFWRDASALCDADAR